MPLSFVPPLGLMLGWECPQPLTDPPRAPGQEEGQVPQLKHPQFESVKSVGSVCTCLRVSVHACVHP